MRTVIEDRGAIIDVVEGDFKACQIITSIKGSVRSNHYHKQGGHWLYVLSGKMAYREFPVNQEAVIFRDGKEMMLMPSEPSWKETVINAGEKVFTGPWMFHQVEFLEDTVLVSCAIGKLDQKTYEEDTVRSCA